MRTISVQVEATVNFEVEIDISDKNYEKFENGEIGSDELEEIYQDKIQNAVSKYDLNCGDIDYTTSIDYV